MSRLLGKHSMATDTIPHTPTACFLMGSPACHRNVFTRLRKCRETHCLTLEFRFFGLSWRTHILEFKLFLIDRGLKARSLWIPYLSLRNIAFEASCVGRVTHRLKTLALRSIFSSNFPWWGGCREGPHNHRVSKQTSKCLFHRFPCRRHPVWLGLSGKYLDTVETQPECEVC